ncbi:MAG: right-handed parallel beta-helix repeat-containing protein [bacterium]|nr:right-handed parallel beta-helix repeat-containing protein [bacterium]
MRHLAWYGGIAIMAAALSANAREFYVAPDGADANPGTQDQPFATLGRARDAVREAKAAADGPITVWVRGGTYALTEPVVFGPDDSGTKECPVVYAAYGDEEPVFTGAKAVTGWKKGEGELWTTEIPEVKAGDWYFRQLFMNGERRARARLPFEGYHTIAGPTEPRKFGFEYKPGDIDANWHNIDDVEVVVLQFWTEARQRIAAIDQDKNIVKFTSQVFRPADWNKGYYIENVREGLLRPGDWYLDRKTGVIEYWAMPGEDMTSVEAVAPVARHWIRVEGDYESGRYVEYLTFRGFTFQYTSWRLEEGLGYSYPQAAVSITPGELLWAGHPSEGLSTPQSQIEVPAGIFARGARHVAFEDNEIAHTGAWGIDLSLGCQDNTVVGNHVCDLGAGGVRVGGTDVTFDDEEEACRNVVSDNHIHDGCNVYLGAPGVWIGQSSGNRVAHNEIHGAFEWAISVGWTWGYMPPNRARDNVIEYNHVHHLGDGPLGTHGAIYFVGVQPGSTARYNLVHDIRGGGSGLVLDNACAGIVLEYNVVHHCQYASFMSNHNVVGNIIQNNVFAMAEETQIHRIGDLPRDASKVHQTGVAYRNIWYWKDAKLFRRDDWPNYDMIIDYNVYYDCTDGSETKFLSHTFAEWQEKGVDKASVFGDPLFVDPDNNDYRLKPESPAFALGFRPIDLSTVGPRPR